MSVILKRLALCKPVKTIVYFKKKKNGFKDIARERNKIKEKKIDSKTQNIRAIRSSLSVL